MTVEQIMTRAVYTCRPGDTLATAARLLWEHDIGFLPVVDERERAVAVLTDRDIAMAAYLRGRPLADIAVAAAMSPGLFSVGQDDSIEAAEELMRRHQIRRLPVLGYQDRVIGIVSLNDLARATVAPGRRGDGLSAVAVEETLRAIGEPRAHH